ncbi:hypothetical protein [Falsiroseomonas sp. CW058]|uniref:hypothetical protein n=1 Tax=Falsiroseomonas sp. CW058 TaxID=3388664 RepID=UPI003D311E16
MLAELLRHCFRSLEHENAVAQLEATEHLKMLLDLLSRSGSVRLDEVVRRAVWRLSQDVAPTSEHQALDNAALAGLRLLAARMAHDEPSERRVTVRRQSFRDAIAATRIAPVTAAPAVPTPVTKATPAAGLDLTTKSLEDTVELWQAALRVLAAEDSNGRHAAAHRRIEAIRQEWTRRAAQPGFRWPTTTASGGGGAGLDTNHWLRHGVFQFVGYRVGKTAGLPQRLRERILAEVFAGPIPPAFPKDYVEEWGKPHSAARLRKMAETLAALTRNAKRRDDRSMAAAVADWEHDLRHLHDRYYVGHFAFAWPGTARR